MITDTLMANDTTSVLKLCSVGLLIGASAVALVAYLQPLWFMKLVVWKSHPSVFWCALTSARVCSLTIDDAPSPATHQILDILLQYDVKATFFIISNQIPGNEDVLRRIVREGHVLGNHLTEDRASILDQLHVFEQKLQECDVALRRFHVEMAKDHHEASPEEGHEAALLAQTAATDDAVVADVTTSLLSSSSSSSSASIKWMRPASGWFTSKMRDIGLRHGYRICMGSVYPHDAQIKSETLNALHLIYRTQCGSVIIVHDRQWTIGVLENALPQLVRQFKFVSLEELSFHHERPS